MGQLERYIHDAADETPLLIKLALIHYQFETIHPFPDGNGRVGRLLLPLLLCERREMTQPLLYLSTFFERHYDEYIDRMFDVSRAGLWEPWIEFFLKGVEEACQDAIGRAGTIRDLHEKYRARIQRARASALLARIVDGLFEVPAVTIPYIQQRLSISYNSAKKHVAKLVEYQILQPSSDENDRPKFFFANEIIHALGGHAEKSKASQ
jgi:Fic family protein